MLPPPGEQKSFAAQKVQLFCWGAYGTGSIMGDGGVSMNFELQINTVYQYGISVDSW